MRNSRKWQSFVLASVFGGALFFAPTVFAQSLWADAAEGTSYGVFADRKAQAVCHAKYMRVDGDGGRVKRDAHHNIRRLSPNPWKFLQCLKVCGYLPTVLLQEDVTRFQNVLCLHTEKATIMDRRFKFFLSECGNRLGCIRILEKASRHDVYAHICALRRKNHRDEELERRPKFQCRFCIGIEFTKDAQLLCLDGFRHSHINSSANASARESALRAR